MRTEATVNLSDAAVAQVMIPVDDFERGIAFYRDVLGIPFLFAAPPMMAFFKSGAVRLLVGVMTAGQRAQRGSAIYFQVADINAVFMTLKANGVQFRVDPHLVNRTPKSELWLAEFTDPDGNPLALMSEVALSGA
jgi:methylmalonyl-CoA/ethylmalonyl-CoA epimerase